VKPDLPPLIPASDGMSGEKRGGIPEATKRIAWAIFAVRKVAPIPAMLAFVIRSGDKDRRPVLSTPSGRPLCV